jgi:metal-responsive CopG/Arc/MetJ family transcriptional regulator
MTITREIISTLHVHLDHHNCLEVIVMRGAMR